MTQKSIEKLKPSTIWKRFWELSQVPRQSKKEEKVRKFIIDYAKKMNLEYKEDSTGNIVVLMPATKGMEKKETVVLQSHLDMVCEKNNDVEHDFDNDPIKLEKKGEWITADGTTLGADNGIGVAAMLAVMTDLKKHGPLELLFTVDEETGLTGASQLDESLITGRTLLNLDTEDEGIFFIGCAGGGDTVGHLEKKTIPAAKDLQAYSLTITGLSGGHSGVDIHTGKANAIKILARVMLKLEHLGARIIEISGGSKRNAIPRESSAIVLLDVDKEQHAQEVIQQYAIALLQEFSNTDPDIKISLTRSDVEVTTMLSEDFSATLIRLLMALPHGIITLSQDIPDLVETSSNLASIETSSTHITIGTSQRSSIESAKEYMMAMVASSFDLANARIETSDGYPGWKPNPASDILQTSEKVYEETFSTKPQIKAIHAGLECGIIGQRFPGIDMISFGPTITGAHSPSEQVHIESVEKFYTFLLALLQN